MMSNEDCKLDEESFRVCVYEVAQGVFGEFLSRDERAEKFDVVQRRIRAFMEAGAPKTVYNFKQILDIHARELPLNRRGSYLKRCVEASWDLIKQDGKHIFCQIEDAEEVLAK